jgi:hypothetical protein
MPRPCALSAGTWWNASRQRALHAAQDVYQEAIVADRRSLWHARLTRWCSRESLGFTGEEKGSGRADEALRLDPRLGALCARLRGAGSTDAVPEVELASPGDRTIRK